MKIRYTDKAQAISQGMRYIEEALGGFGLKKSAIYKTLLMAEESLVNLLDAAPLDTDVKILVTRRLGSVSVKLTAQGEPIEATADSALGAALDTEDMDPDAELAIRAMVLRAFSDRIKYSRRGRRNTVQIVVARSERAQLYWTMGALVAAIVFGVALRLFAPQMVQTLLDTYVLVPVRTLFMNALKMMVGPVVFFSIVSCVANFGDLQQFGKIGGKVIGFYMMTTVIAAAIGMALGLGVELGTPGMLAAPETAVAGTQTEISIFQTLLNIIPSNIVKPFLDADMLQIIFIAVLLGVATGMVDEHSDRLRTFFDAGNALFLKAVTMVVKLTPLVVFCAVSSLVLTTGTQTLLSVVGYVALVFLALLLMIAAYCILMVLMARLNPLTFLKKVWPTMLTAFSLGSSSATMPVTLKCCEKLGISSKISSFSIPLGATINMDGTCVYLAIASIFLADIYGVALSTSTLVSIAFSIIVLSVGAPGVPGSGLICLSVLLVQIGVPVEALGVIMGVDSLMGMFRTASNVLGDIVGSLVVAKGENMLDMDVFLAEEKQ